jgi:mannose-6-phosphate isomerase-like protein (cupin superfamily)
MSGALVVRSDEGTPGEEVGWIFKASGDQTQGRFDFMVGPVEYLSGPPLHIHEDQDDTFYVLEGVLTVQIQDELVELGPGDFATVPPGIPHTFDNLHSDQPPVLAINLMTPGGFNELFAEVAKAVGEGADRTRLQSVAAEHGVTSVGPPLREKLGLTDTHWEGLDA